MSNITWESRSDLTSKRYTCGHCGSDITSNEGYRCFNGGRQVIASIYICHHCLQPTFFTSQKQVPGPKLGASISKLPKDIDDIYSEVRDATAANAYTAAVLAARKLLMHIAVECGAKQGKAFVDYVDYLVDNHYAPPKSKTWVDKIRQLGNEANHEIVIMGANEASNIIKFLEMLLLFNYEFTDTKEPADDTETVE